MTNLTLKNIVALGLVLLLAIGLTGCSSLPNYERHSAAAPAMISGSGSLLNLCSVGSLANLTPQICVVRLDAVDGYPTGHWASGDIAVDPGKHRLQLKCLASRMGDTGVFFTNFDADLQSGREYRTESAWHEASYDAPWGGHCNVWIIDKKTNEVVGKGDGVPENSKF